MLTLEGIRAIFEKQFGPPFLPEGHVRVALCDSDTKGARQSLCITIGNRDIEIDADGKLIGAGTMLV